jgi:endonuclease/exonuclease/phosphatase family metal-dependent hydrolase
MRFATYNVEWFANLFDREGALLADDAWSGRQDVTRRDQAESLGIVFTAIDADAVMVIEAPDGSRRKSTVRALENFAAAYGLRQRKAVAGFASETQQEIALLYDPDRLTAVHDPRGGTAGEGGVPRFDGSFRIDLDIDARPDRVVWSKPPLELAVTTAGGVPLRLIGVHAKSKAPHGAEGAEAIMRLAIENRRKQLAQCIWLRRRVDEHLAAGESLMVMGDFNDGPGLDEYEKLFGRSGVEVVLGEEGQVQLHDPHANEALARHFAAPATARFYLPEQGRWLSALLDYIMISPDLMAKAPAWRIWHPFDDPVCYATVELREALLTASDHFPVTLDLDL